MLYDVQTRTGFSGVSLIVRFPEEELDKKALNTIMAENPPFLLPFRMRTIDGMMECTYDIGNNLKLIYKNSQKTPSECAAFWETLLQPLIDCDDWFMDPFCFALRSDLIYVPRVGEGIRYVYIPSYRQNCSSDELLELVKELARENPVSDVGMENQILRSLMEGFNPVGFVKMLKERADSPGRQPEAYAYRETPAPAYQPPAPERPPQPVRPAPEPPKQQPPSAPRPSIFSKPQPKEPPVKNEPPVREAPKQAVSKPVLPDGDIFIDFDGAGSKDKKAGKKSKPAVEKPAKERPVKEKKESGGLFRHNKDKAKDQGKMLYMGPPMSQQQYPAEPAAPVQSQAYPQEDYRNQAVSWAGNDEDDAVTDFNEKPAMIGLELIGDRSYPASIPVRIQPNQIFTIGRFDVNLGKQQSSFEFSKEKKSISRHHAVIERDASGAYTITDLSSKGGTFVNGQRLQPNVPEALHNGIRVSFGSDGADYTWRE